MRGYPKSQKALSGPLSQTRFVCVRQQLAQPLVERMHFRVIGFGQRNDAADVQVIAVVFDAQRIAALHLLDEFAPAPHQPGAAFAHHMLRITVLAEIILHLGVSHAQSAPRFEAWRWK